MQDIREVLNNNPYLNLVTSNVYDIPARLKEYDPSFFIVYNNKYERLEVHSLENKGSTFCMVVPYEELDERILVLIRRNDLKTRGRAIFKELDKDNERLEKSREREKANYLESASKEMYYHFKKAVI